MITLKKLRDYFRLDDGAFVRNAPPCIRCTEEKFRECLKRNVGCDEYHRIATERGWDKEQEGFDY